MRGGRFEQKSNVRNAEALLESRSVAEIREVEVATRKEIQDKQEELRQLVGASYRDLIDSADSIVYMGKCCDCIMSNLAGMAQGFDYLKHAAAAAVPTRASVASDTGRQELYCIGSRVKYLVDTPEKIWGCLDEHMYLEAAERYLRARQVHSLLTGTQLLAHFPLLRHQWQLVKAFQKQISNRSKERLQESGFGAAEYAVALAALAIVENLSSAQVFTLFLDTRKAWLRSFLRAAMSVKPDTLQGYVAILTKAIDMVQLTLCHIGQLFLEVSHGHAPLLFTTILTAPPSSQLFGGISNPENEVRVWKQHREKLDATMVPLSGDYIAEASVCFLKVCAEELSVEAKPVLDWVSTGKDLAEMEASVKLHIDKQSALQNSLDWLKRAFGSQVINSPWDFLSTLLLKSSLNLWDVLLESMFVRRVKAIINSRIHQISLTSVVGNCLDSINSAACLKQPSIGLLRSLFVEENVSWKQGREWTAEVNACFGPNVCRIKENVEEGLKGILQDLLMFIGDPQSSPRISELAPFLQESVLSCISRISKDLEDRLQTLSHDLEHFGKVPDPLGSLVNVERALFLGRLSLSIGHHLQYLRVILGPPEQWLIYDTKGPCEVAMKETGHILTRRNSWSDRDVNHFRRRAASDAVPSRLKNLQTVLDGLWDTAHCLWVSWSTNMLIQIFLRDLGMDDSISAATVSKGWEETTFKQETDDSEVEIKMSLPAMASPCAVNLLFLANQEIYRVGGHVLDKTIIHSFATKLLDKVLAAYERFLSGDCHVSERGALQLLFDVRFMADVLVGLQEVSSAEKKSSSQKQVKGLLSTLYSNLDPIDWATYEPQLWENEQRSYQRSAVLFGFLTQLNRLYTECSLKNQPPTDANTICLSSTVSRFTSLPISMPLLNGGRTGSGIDGGASETRKGYQQEAKEAENFMLDDSMGFTSLVNPRPLLKTFMGQVGGTLKFGSIIGDAQVGRLRDKSAAAISTFGDMLPALSSLASGAH